MCEEQAKSVEWDNVFHDAILRFISDFCCFSTISERNLHELHLLFAKIFAHQQAFWMIGCFVFLNVHQACTLFFAHDFWGNSWLLIQTKWSIIIRLHSHFASFFHEARKQFQAPISSSNPEASRQSQSSKHCASLTTQEAKEKKNKKEFLHVVIHSTSFCVAPEQHGELDLMLTRRSFQQHLKCCPFVWSLKLMIQFLKENPWMKFCVMQSDTKVNLHDHFSPHRCFLSLAAAAWCRWKIWRKNMQLWVRKEL